MLWSSDPTELGPMLANNKQTCNRELGHSFNKYWLRAGAKHSTGPKSKEALDLTSDQRLHCLKRSGKEQCRAGWGRGCTVCSV